ncbi:MAG: hypothetical protein GY804_10720 [Alphaproteobacteria bacterium]|nr:hypothetical protein [Alphaproteobacteria bacterium]
MHSKPPKHQAYLSYDVDKDGRYVDRLLASLHEYVDFFSEGPLDDPSKSHDAEYVTKQIREKHLKWSSATIVLCGEDTFKKKKIDWEIHATLQNKQALMGVILPSAEKAHNGKVIVPERLMDNVKSGYATCIGWSTNPNYIRKHLNSALERRENTFLIKNSRIKMIKDLSSGPKPPQRKSTKKKTIYYSP